MRFSRYNLGALMAIVAGLLVIFPAVWPSTPHAKVFGSGAWLVLAMVAGVAFVVAPFLPGRWLWLSRAMLLVGGLALLVSGFVFGRFGSAGLLAALLDVVPAIVAILAIVAAFTIGPIRRHAVPGTATATAESRTGAPLAPWARGRTRHAAGPAVGAVLSGSDAGGPQPSRGLQLLEADRVAGRGESVAHE